MPFCNFYRRQAAHLSAPQQAEEDQQHGPSAPANGVQVRSNRGFLGRARRPKVREGNNGLAWQLVLDHMHAEAGAMGIAPRTLMRLSHTSRTLAEVAGDNRYWLPNSPSSALGAPLPPGPLTDAVVRLPVGQLPVQWQPLRLPADLPHGTLRQSYRNRMGDFLADTKVRHIGQRDDVSAYRRAYRAARRWQEFVALRSGQLHSGAYQRKKDQDFRADRSWQAMTYLHAPYLFDYACEWLRQDWENRADISMFHRWSWQVSEEDTWSWTPNKLADYNSMRLMQEPALQQKILSFAREGEEWSLNLSPEWYTATHRPNLWGSILLRLPRVQQFGLLRMAWPVPARLDLLLLGIHVAGSAMWTSIQSTLRHEEAFLPLTGHGARFGQLDAHHSIPGHWHPSRAEDFAALRQELPTDSFIWGHNELRPILEGLSSAHDLDLYARRRDQELTRARG